jgi:site-specific DNA recombinase
MKKPLRFFAYLRKSTDDKVHQVASLPRQENSLREFARQEGLRVVEFFEESRSAKLPGRPVFSRMLDRLEAGEADALLCWDIDRLYRNPVDEGRVRWLLQRGVITIIRTPTRQFLPQDAGLLMGVEGGLATDYVIRLAKNIKDGVKDKLQRGEWPGAKPLGYVYDRRLRNIVPDPEKSKIVQTLFEEFGGGRIGLSGISQRLFEMGVTSKAGAPWSKSAVRKLLVNRLYTGVMKWKSDTFEGKYKAIITAEQFERVQKALKSRSKPRRTRQGHNFPFCALFRCSCGSAVSAQWAKGRGGLYRYYRCTRYEPTCTEPYLQEKFVMSQCLEALKAIAITPAQAGEIRAEIDAEAKKDGLGREREWEAITNSLADLQKKLDKLTAGYLDGKIDEESYQAATRQLVVRKTALKHEKQRFQRTSSVYWNEPSKEAVNTLELAFKLQTGGTACEIAELIRKVGTNHLFTRKTVSFSFAEPYAFVPSLLGVSPSRPMDAGVSHETPAVQSTTWCTREDLNLHSLRNQILSLARLPFRHACYGPVEKPRRGPKASRGVMCRECCSRRLTLRSATEAGVARHPYLGWGLLSVSGWRTGGPADRCGVLPTGRSRPARAGRCCGCRGSAPLRTVPA